MIDPVLFRAVYEEHLGQLLVDDQLPGLGQSPVFEDPIIDQPTSSSLSVPSPRKLKRSKTINASSLSSITEPTLSNRKAKRTDSMRGVDNLTQVTTPRKSTDATRKDPWEVPTSSASDKPSDVSVKEKSRNSERNTTLKTYGRQIRRTQTVAHSRHGASIDRRLSSPMEDDSPQIVNQNRSVQSQEDDDLPIPKSKRHKTGPSMNVELLETVLKEPLNNIRKVRIKPHVLLLLANPRFIVRKRFLHLVILLAQASGLCPFKCNEVRVNIPRLEQTDSLLSIPRILPPHLSQTRQF